MAATQRELLFSQMLEQAIYEAAEQAETARPIGDDRDDEFDPSNEELTADPKLMLVQGEGLADIETDEQSGALAVHLPTGEIFFITVAAARDADHARSLALLKMIESDVEETP